mmetsp:Transcript_4050/g.6424  ORF Transcript_4050/g.6424 Transcript_4050/m.6424 type:complete len:300 (+) Transcript_4050:84-983(+)
MSDKPIQVTAVATTIEGEPMTQPVSGDVTDPIDHRIPDDFLKVGCCACSCNNCDFPSCFGVKSAGTCLCFEGESVYCKYLENDPNACCLFASGESTCIMPGETLCRVYQQRFCFEFFCSFPFVETGYRNTPVAVQTLPGREDGKGNGNVTVCSGHCCTIDSCYCDFPACLGCYRKGVCLCCEGEMIQCKPMCGQEKVKENLLCILCKGSSLLIMPYTCCKGVSQVCCLDSRYAFPCDDEVPCIWTPCIFCTCCVQGKCQLACCTTIDELVGQRNPALMNNQTSSSGGTVVAQPAPPSQM